MNKEILEYREKIGKLLNTNYSLKKNLILQIKKK